MSDIYFYPTYFFKTVPSTQEALGECFLPWFMDLNSNQVSVQVLNFVGTNLRRHEEKHFGYTYLFAFV